MLVPEHLKRLAEAVARETLIRTNGGIGDDLPAGLVENIALRIMQHNCEQLGMTRRDFHVVVDTPGTRLNEMNDVSING